MEESEACVHDIIIVGAGPCGLAVAARLREATPSALFTDSEHQRYHWMRASTDPRRKSKPTRATRRSKTAADRLIPGPHIPTNARDEGLDIVVLDAFSASWMGAWEKKFEDLQIRHLRSPMFFHPDPRDRDGLLEFAYKHGPTEIKDLREIKGVVGKGLSKHQRKQQVKARYVIPVFHLGEACQAVRSRLPIRLQNLGNADQMVRTSQKQETTYLDERDRHDYFRPSQSLFSAYCKDIAARYDLSTLVQKSQVLSISFSSVTSLFTLETTTGVRHARIVILATGPTAKPTLPKCNPFSCSPTGSVSHAFSPNGVIPTSVKAKIQARQTTTLAVIGGGLTSTQISALAINSGVTKVYHFTRGPLKTKHFDVDLKWVGKYKNYHLASFWSADSDEERFEIIKGARGGGSVNPEYKAILLDLIKQGKVVLEEHTEIISATWSESTTSWTVQTQPPTKERLPAIDHVVFATGVLSDMTSVPMMQPIIHERPIKMIGGMPAITDDLMWDEECPLFVTGRLAGLRLGPGAGNLEGARQGAERIAWKIGELVHKWEVEKSVGFQPGNLEHLVDVKDGTRDLRKSRADSGYGSFDNVDMRRLGLGVENQFCVLALDSD